MGKILRGIEVNSDDDDGPEMPVIGSGSEVRPTPGPGGQSAKRVTKPGLGNRAKESAEEAATALGPRRKQPLGLPRPLARGRPDHLGVRRS
jgi:hypothetical protein